MSCFIIWKVYNLFCNYYHPPIPSSILLSSYILLSSFISQLVDGGDVLTAGMSAADAKAAEAAQSAYYDPNKPQCAYVPPPAYYVSIAICDQQTIHFNIMQCVLVFMQINN